MLSFSGVPYDETEPFPILVHRRWSACRGNIGSDVLFRGLLSCILIVSVWTPLGCGCDMALLRIAETIIGIQLLFLACFLASWNSLKRIFSVLCFSPLVLSDLARLEAFF
jgi:hypothetical protein